MNPLWKRQVRGVLELELRKALFSGRAVPMYFVALLPVFLVTLFVVVQHMFGVRDAMSSIENTGLRFAGVYQVAILRSLLFAGCVWTFMNLFRGEVLDRSLHYYFLSPIRREVLITGKFLAGWVTTSIFFVGSTVACMFVLYSYYGVGTAARYLLAGPGLGHLLSYVGVTTLACLGYGAVFLLVGLFSKNLVIPAVLIWAWEGMNPFLPSLLKKVSVIFYLDSLLPVRLARGAFAVIADPVPAWIAVPGFLIFTAAALVLAGLRIRRMEISYATD